MAEAGIELDAVKHLIVEARKTARRAERLARNEGDLLTADRLTLALDDMSKALAARNPDDEAFACPR